MADQILRYPELLDQHFLHPDDFIAIARQQRVSRFKAIAETCYDLSSFAAWQYKGKQCNLSVKRALYHCAVAKGWLR